MHDRTTRLRQMMAQHDLTARDVARITGRSLRTIRIWRCNHPARVIPENTLRLLELEVQVGA